MRQPGSVLPADLRSDPLIRSRLVRPAVIALLAAAAVFALLAVHFAGVHGPSAIDRTVGRHLITNIYGNGSSQTRAIADLGGPIWVPTFMALAIAGFLSAGLRRAAALVLLSPPIASLLSEWVLKPAIGRMMVHGGYEGLAFPSGHATGICSIAFPIMLVAVSRVRGVASAVRAATVAAIGFGVCTAVSLALIAAQYHYLSDTIGGALVALVTVLGLALAIDAAASRSTTTPRPRQRVTAGSSNA